MARKLKSKFPKQPRAENASLPGTDSADSFPKTSDRKIVLALCLLAAIRVFLYSAAFPLFNNVDEPYHLDLVLKYSHGEIPRKLEPLSLETLRDISLYASPEYLESPQQYPNGVFPPPLWTMPEQAKAVLARLPAQPAVINNESSQAPLYYAVAALWLQAGRLCGLTGGFLLYWIRFLNIFLAAALVWLGYAAAKRTLAGERFVILGVPALLAILPQDAFYSIQNDVLSPICFGLAFIGLVQWVRSENPSARLSTFTGLALAAVCLVKVSNLPLLAVAALTIALRSWRLGRSGKLRYALPSLAMLLLCAGLPMACWFAWNLRNFGDLTASAAKIQALGWTYKPVSEWGHHPIFTLSGLFYFWSELLPRFWRGEFVWGLQPLASPVADAFYWMSSLVLTGAAAISLLSRFAPKGGERETLVLGLCSFWASVAYLALLSMVFDFGRCYYPSRALPYFTSGRLLLGVLIPFLMVYLHGLSWLTKLRWWLLAGMAVLIAGSQIVEDQVAFSSAYNWFHLF